MRGAHCLCLGMAPLRLPPEPRSHPAEFRKLHAMQNHKLEKQVCAVAAGRGAPVAAPLQARSSHVAPYQRPALPPPSPPPMQFHFARALTWFVVLLRVAAVEDWRTVGVLLVGTLTTLAPAFADNLPPQVYLRCAQPRALRLG